eukprot:COSAG04_NODE_96_length_26486_cov_136.642817_4_plen_139_part_00
MTAVEDGEPAASSEKPEPAAAPMPEAEVAAEPGAAPSTSDPKAEDSGAGGAEAAELPSECVKVAVRVRPLSSKEHAEGSTACVRFPQPNQIVIGKDRTFTFDSVFAPEVRPCLLRRPRRRRARGTSADRRSALAGGAE